MSEPKVETLAETDMYGILAVEEDGDLTYLLELGNVTIHMMPEEWEEFVMLVSQLKD